MAYQSLYRRYRPRRFGEVRGQEHVVGALRNAVRNSTAGHAYLFSGPRGTGKTSTARILAKALNCENLQDGEPCCDCTPCQDMEAGRSFDLFELDAASNNGVDAIRDLIERSAVGSPGRTKVYILDEVHMLTPGASNALLKTLEEPPDHVRFVLATTDPQKVLPTIKSRTQHYEFQLLSAQELETQVRWIISDADLDVDEQAIAWVVHQGRGSSRDTLSALDQVVAAGGVVTREEPVAQLYESLAKRDTGLAVVAVAEALAQGHDPRVLGAAFLDSLRDTFLISLDVEVPHLMEDEQAQLRIWAGQLGTPLLTRSMESLGAALVEMRQAADPRVPLEVALVRLTASGDASLDGLVARIEQLEQALANGATTTGVAPTAAPGAASEQAASKPASAEPPRSARAAEPDSGHADEAPTHTANPEGPAKARAELARMRAAEAAASGANAEASKAPARPAAPAPPPAAPSTRSAPPQVPGGRPAASQAPTPPPPLSTTSQRSESAPPAGAPAPGERGGSESGGPNAPSTDRGSSAASAPPSAAGEQPSSPSGEPSGPSTGAPAPGGALPTAAEVTLALDEVVVPQLKGVAKALYSTGQVVSVGDDAVIFALAIGSPLERAEKSRSDIEAALAAHFGRPVPLKLIEDGDVADHRSPGVGVQRATNGSTSPAASEPEPPDEDEDETRIDISQLENADNVASTGIDRLTKAFPGAVLIDEDEVTK